MTTPQRDNGKPLDQPIDLLHYAYLLFDTKWIILVGSLLAGFLVMQYSKNLPDIYEGVAKVDIIEPGDPGGMDPDNRSVREATDLIETGFALAVTKDNHSKVTLARLRSRNFTRYFLNKHNVYTVLYPDKWNNVTQEWEDGFQVDPGEAFLDFDTRVRTIVIDEETSIVRVKMRDTDPTLAAELANLYVYEFNEYMRNIELEEIQAKISYLKQRLQNVKYIQMEQILYRLIEAQEATATLARGEEYHSLEMLDPATRVYDRFSPARKKMTILATFGAGFLITVAIIGIDILRQMKSKLDHYAVRTGRPPLRERKFSIRGIVLRILKPNRTLPSGDEHG